MSTKQTSSSQTQVPQRKTRVFLLTPPRQDLDIQSAANYGEVTYVYEHGGNRPSIFKVEEFMDKFLADIAARGFDSKVDMFCIAGQMNGVAIAFAALCCAYDELNVLMFSSSSSSYEKLRVRTP